MSYDSHASSQSTKRSIGPIPFLMPRPFGGNGKKLIASFKMLESQWPQFQEVGDCHGRMQSWVMSQSHGVSEPSDDKLRQYGLAA